MAKHEIEVEIDQDGNVRLAAHGIQGKACLPILHDLQVALGEAKAPPTPTQEMHAVATVTGKVKR
jgi:hypothetical protein